MDHFALLGMPRRYRLDADDLERRFRERSRRLHPDRFARAEARERRLSLDQTTRLNDALRILREDRSRAEYLLKLQGHDPVAETRALQDPEFLEEQLLAREQMAEARAEGDQETIRRLAEQASARLAGLMEEIAALFAAEGLDHHRDIARHLARARYHDNLLAEAQAGALPGAASLTGAPGGGRQGGGSTSAR